MKYISTRGQIEPIGFADATLMGLADDGGLIIPEQIPSIADRLDELAGMNYAELAYEIIRLYATDIPEALLREIISRTYGPDYFVNDSSQAAQVSPMAEVGDLRIMELWHGPTLAFKDVALQLLGNLFEYFLAQRGGRLNILGATSGDTGSAAIYGCRGHAGIDIFIMHPAGRVSPIQQKQMTTVLDANVHNLAVTGSFDDCQTIMKTVAADIEFKRKYSLGAVNSVNWARVLAQVVYYVYGALQMRDAGPVNFSVPTGNFGDILAGWYAKQMGAPIGRLILATNENDILSRFFNTGVYSKADVAHTLSPSMDIQVASNFERYLYYRLGSDAAALRETMDSFASQGSLSVEGEADGDFVASRATTADVLEVIERYARELNYVLDPHTACGVVVAEQLGLPNTICLATAHPAKFPAAIAQATGDESLADHPAIAHLADAEERFVVVENDIDAIRQVMIDTLDV